MTTMVLEPEPDILTLEDELGDHECPLHDDMDSAWLELDDSTRRLLEAMCGELAWMEQESHQLQLWIVELRVIDRAWHEAFGIAPMFRRPSHKTLQAEGRLENGLRQIESIRKRMRRLMAGDPEFDPAVDGPVVDLWQRSAP